MYLVGYLLTIIYYRQIFLNVKYLKLKHFILKNKTSKITQLFVVLYYNINSFHLIKHKYHSKQLIINFNKYTHLYVCINRKYFNIPRKTYYFNKHKYLCVEYVHNCNIFLLAIKCMYMHYFTMNQPNILMDAL